MGNAHGHALDLPSHFAAIDGVGRGEAEAKHLFHLLVAPAVSEHPAALRHVGEVGAGGAARGFLQLGFFVGLHDVAEDSVLAESGVHGLEVVGGHATSQHVGGVGTHVAGEVVDTLDGPEATETSLSLAALVLGHESRRGMVQDLDEGLAEVIGGGSWWAGAGD